MISLKLAEQLKKAGFPQEPVIGIGGVDGEIFGGFYFTGPPEGCGGTGFFNSFVIEKIKNKRTKDVLIKLPTSEELITAIHDLLDKKGGYIEISLKRFWILENTKIGHIFNWEASAKFGKGCQEGDTSIWDIRENGKCPEEATASLWLRLSSSPPITFN